MIGHFDESQLPRPGAPAQMEGFNPTTGVAIKMFVDRSFGAVHQSLFLIQYMPGAKIDPHDHAFEESYLIVSGGVRAIADGKTYDLGAGDVIWTSVGCIHSFANVGTEPVRWIETQAPLPPAKRSSASSATGRSTRNDWGQMQMLTRLTVACSGSLSHGAGRGAA